MSGTEKTNGSLAMAPRVITIPASSQESPRRLRVAAYARVSSNSEDQKHSFVAQNAYYSKLITDNPDWELVDVYADKGITGTSVEKRDDFLRMMEDCRKGRIDRILVKSSFSKQVVKNTGQRPKYLIQNHHDAIIPREQFDAVQFEMARRRAQTDRSRKSVPTGVGKYSGKYALSGLLFCGECGTAYRRVVWTQHGEKRAVWRCTSRLDYGKKYCKDSPTLDEEPLQQAVLAAINASMSDHIALKAQLTDAMEQELAPIPGESMSLGDIDRAIAELGEQFDHLLLEASGARDVEEYAERFRAISTAMEELKRRKANIQNIRQEQESVKKRVREVASVLGKLSAELTEWDDNMVYQMLEKVTVLSREMIRVTLRNGMEIEQTVEQPKRRKFV